MNYDNIYEPFQIIRNDEIVAVGCIFLQTGKCVVNWLGEYRSVVVWDSIDDLRKVSGHPNTKFLFFKLKTA